MSQASQRGPNKFQKLLVSAIMCQSVIVNAVMPRDHVRYRYRDLKAGGRSKKQESLPY